LTHKKTMKALDISKAKNPDLHASYVAMERAAKLARDVAIETNTAIIVLEDGKLVRITADQLRAEKSKDDH
jgi:mRNA degradation ribonuclease J1/J2